MQVHGMSHSAAGRERERWREVKGGCELAAAGFDLQTRLMRPARQATASLAVVTVACLQVMVAAVVVVVSQEMERKEVFATLKAALLLSPFLPASMAARVALIRSLAL